LRFGRLLLDLRPALHEQSAMAESSVLQFRSPRQARPLSTGPNPLAAALAQALAEVPQRPAGLAACVAYLQEDPELLATREIGVRALLRFRDALFTAPGRDQQMRAVWRESLVTACVTSQLARLACLDGPVLTAGGLLHRMGDIWALTALARAEAATQVRLLGAAANEAYAARDADLAARMVASWQLTAEVATAVLGWRSCLDARSSSASLSPAQAVYLGHLLAMEQLHSNFCTPGVIDAAAAELDVSPELLDAVRAASAGADSLLQRLD
jgi:hypothetical protein